MVSDITKGINRVQLHNIPEELRSYNQWIVWKAVPNRDGKITKIPVNPQSGGNASTNNPDSWVTFEDAYTYYVQNKDNGIAGIGFVFSKDDPFCGVDLDDCRDPITGQFNGWAVNILKQLNSYSEISPSDTGVKIFLKGKLPGHGRNFGNVEVYDSGRYFTVTGDIFNGYPKTVQDRTAEIKTLYYDLGKKKQKEDIPAIEVDCLPGDIDIDSLKINYGTKKLIKEGEKRGKRSEAMMSVIDSLVSAGVSDQDIIRIFETFKIGEKYHEKGPSKEQWLRSQIEKAKDFVAIKKAADMQDGVSLKFPYHIITGAAGAFANTYGKHLETPKEFLYMSYLTCLGNILSTRITIASEIAPQPRLYTLLLGQSADERKSTALKKTVEHFKGCTDGFQVCWGVGSAEGLQKKLEETTDGLLLCLDEFKQFVSKCKIDASVLLPCVNTLYEFNRYENRTKTTKIDLREAHLSMLAASTVETYDRTWHTSFTDIGFTNRLFLVPGTAKRKHSLPAKIPDQDKHIMKSNLQEVLRHVGGFRELDTTLPAYDIYDNWYMQFERSIHSKRLDTYALRLMCLLAANDLKNELDEDTVKKVIALCDWQLEVRKTHDPIDADNKIAKMEEKIRRQLRKGQKKEYELKQNVNAKRDGLWCFSTALKNLERFNEIIFNKKSKKWKLLPSKV